MKRLLTLVLCLLSILSWSQDPSTFKTYFGLLHGHTMISDGSGTPEEAYKMAKDAGLDFFALTEHNHKAAEGNAGSKERADGVLIATNHNLYNGTSLVDVVRQLTHGQTENVRIKPLQTACKDATTNNFLAIYGQEFSSISSGNHIGVLNAKEVLEIDNGDFTSLYDYVRNEDDQGHLILQMNHPDIAGDIFATPSKPSQINAMRNDYGYDEAELGDNFKEFVDHIDNYVQLIEVLSGPALDPKVYGNTFDYAGHNLNESDYYYYLTQGLHVSPSAGQDNHYKTWGIATDARIGVFASALTMDGICEAFHKYRTFATTDKNLSVSMSMNDSFMGSMISRTNGGSLKIKVNIHDEDEPNASYKVTICGGPVKPQKYNAEVKVPVATISESSFTGNGEFSLPTLTASGKAEFYYVRVKQGNDRVWTAPVWVNHKENTDPPSPIEEDH